jgi:AcrR family transcriptional regulator
MARPVKTPFSPDLRTVISTVAETLFAERGFDGTYLREIAERAGSTKALIYHYYGSKEELYLSVLESAASEVTTQVEAIAVGNDSPEDKIRRVIRVFLDAYQAHPQRFRVLQRVVDEHHVAAVTLAERWFSRVYAALGVIAEDGVRHKQFKPLLPPLVPVIVVGLIIHVLRTQELQDRITPGFSAPQLLATLEDVILGLLRARVGERSARSRRRVEPSKMPVLPVRKKIGKAAHHASVPSAVSAHRQTQRKKQ